ncbi:DUF4129 domain-containing protein [Chitinophaga sp. Mgbs1]|uniref:DUF4129 domain-containing protein n=1 Tax=Chitinophaga solisilvae TaxID=1233460 RepID=A0A433WGY7_9BACT|nr:DUF4129 domain-containing protein [Chitinophaga solisilvae]
MSCSKLKKYCQRLLIALMLCLPVAGIAQDSTAEAEEPDVAAYEMRQVPDSLMQQLKKDSRLQYQDKTEKPKKDNNNIFTGLFNFLFYLSGAIRYLVVALVVVGVGALVYLFMKNNGLSIFKKPKLLEGLDEIPEESLQSAAEFEEKIKTAIQEKNIRQAVRWWYLYTLFQLAGKQLIIQAKDKTNNDYLRSMRETPYYKTFSTLTMDYEYIWYGGFEVSEDSFREINQQFRDFNNHLAKAS